MRWGPWIPRPCARRGCGVIIERPSRPDRPPRYCSRRCGALAVIATWTRDDRRRMRAKGAPKRRARYREFMLRRYRSALDVIKAGFESGYRRGRIVERQRWISSGAPKS